MSASHLRMLPYRLTPNMYSYKEKPTWYTIYLQYITSNTSTCFRRIYSPSSGGTPYGYNNWYLLFCLMRSNFCAHQCHKHAHGPLACACTDTRGLRWQCWQYGLWWSTAPSLLIFAFLTLERQRLGAMLHHRQYHHEHV